MKTAKLISKCCLIACNMRSYERLSQLEKLGIEIEEFKVYVPLEDIEYSGTQIANYDDGGKEYELYPHRGNLRIPEHDNHGHTRLPRLYTNVGKKAKNRYVYLNILKLEEVDISRLQDRIVYCRGHLLWLPDVSYYFRLPRKEYLDIKSNPEKVKF